MNFERERKKLQNAIDIGNCVFTFRYWAERNLN